MHFHNYFVYITINSAKDVFYIGVTNDLEQRLTEHYLNKGDPGTFAGHYHCYNLIYFERYTQIKTAIKREKQLKGWIRRKKEGLIKGTNPLFLFLNRDIMDWPPAEESSR
jgi:putative endonuclease